MRNNRTRLILTATCLCAAVASAQSERKLTARELFYTPVAPKSVPAPPPSNPEKTAPAKTATAKPPRKTTEVAVKRNTERPSRPSQHISEGVSFQTVSNESQGPLALRYTVLKHVGGDQYQEVDKDTIFRSGDKIRVAVEANDDGYLYIVQRGTTKTWNLLFPNSETADGDNRIRRNKRYEIPSEARFSFDANPGDETLFVVLSRKPEPDLEKLIYDLSTNAPAKPAGTEKRPESRPSLLAQARIDDNVVAGLRTRLVSRDLVFEKVDSKKSDAESGEKAFYVATPDGSNTARVVAETVLKHR